MWKIDKCTKCGYPKLVHKKMHRDATCTRKKEKQDVLCKNWEEYTKRIRPLMKVIKEDYEKEIQEGILLKGLKDLIELNTKVMNSNMTTLMTTLKKETVSSPSESTEKEVEVTRVTKLTKPAKVAIWTKDMLLETYNKQVAA